MEHISTTPFGRRPLSLAMVASQTIAKECPRGVVVHKWQVFRAICEGRSLLGVSERALSVLNALLTFHPETTLSGQGDLIVFPSNQQLALRAHGMAPATLRRHLAVLVDAGIVVRRDSPNGKRYARKNNEGAIEKAFGFDLSPFVARAEEFERLVDDIRTERRAVQDLRERITIARRDIVKMIDTALEESIPGDWKGRELAYRRIVGGLPRTADSSVLKPIAADLEQLADEIAIVLEKHVNSRNMSANESQTERHIQNSNPKPQFESEPRQPSDEAAIPKPSIETPKREYAFPLGMVLDACPDLIDYARGGIGSWREFFATVAAVRPMLGISPSAWEEASGAMGESQAAMVVACILQRGSAIGSAGGYLRDLTRRSRAGEFGVGPMVMALLSGKRRKEKRSA